MPTCAYWCSYRRLYDNIKISCLCNYMWMRLLHCTLFDVWLWVSFPSFSRNWLVYTWDWLINQLHVRLFTNVAGYSITNHTRVSMDILVVVVVVVVVEPGGLCVLSIFIGYNISTPLTFYSKTCACATCSAFRAFHFSSYKHEYIIIN